jgi:hypothetical protein
MPADSYKLATSGASLGGGSDSSTRDNGMPAAAAGGLDGVGIARKVIFSLASTGAGSFGGGGGTLERASGISSWTGASPPRTTTAWRGGVFKPGRAMKPPRGVAASPENAGAESNGSSSCD